MNIEEKRRLLNRNENFDEMPETKTKAATFSGCGRILPMSSIDVFRDLGVSERLITAYRGRWQLSESVSESVAFYR